MQKPVALTVRLSADAFELVSNGADPGIVKNAGPVQNLTNLPSDTVAFVSMRGLGATVENVANEKYWESAQGGFLSQGDPRVAKLSASVDF